jgi:hypothetical protein
MISPKQFFQGDYPYYPEVMDIVEEADIIIVGDVVDAKKVENLMTDVTPDKSNKEAIPYTLSSIRVTEVVKGNVKVGDVLTIKQLGDYEKKPEETLYKMDGYLEENSRELMFLAEYENSPYSPLNPAQGSVEVKEDGSLYSSNQYSLFGYKGVEAKTKTSKNNNDTLDSAIEEIKSCIKDNVE